VWGSLEPPLELSEAAVKKLHASLDAARPMAAHVWRDTKPVNDDGTFNAYVEIPRGDRRKWEFDMARNTRALDRVMPDAVGGYPVNYGFVPQTISYDGDPFDALILGPPLDGGEVARGVAVGLMQMEDEKGLDSKILLSPVGPEGRALHDLTPADRERIGGYFRVYKRHQPGAFSKVPGWSAAAIGRAFLTTTHAFFLECRERVGSCLVSE
jgi:inorganic pyrophosphatase